TGGGGSTNVSAPAGCVWTTDASGATFVTITGGSTGSGSGQVSYTVAANAGAAGRTATLTIAGQSYSISQAGTGQQAVCNANTGVVPTVALEGRTEAVGDLMLVCTGLASAVTADVVLTMNATVTNTLVFGSMTDATLTIGNTTLNGQLLGYNAI